MEQEKEGQEEGKEDLLGDERKDPKKDEDEDEDEGNRMKEEERGGGSKEAEQMKEVEDDKEGTDPKESHPENPIASLFLLSPLSSPQEQQIRNLLLEGSEAFLQSEAINNSPCQAEKVRDAFSSPFIPLQRTPPHSYFSLLLDKCAHRTTGCHSPKMVGHMTTSLPFFHRPLSELVTALNQNTVKTETSAGVTHVERECVGMLHKAFFRQGDPFYRRHLHDPDSCLGAVTSGGTLANLTALWVARNRALGPREGFAGVAQEGLVRALKAHGYSDAVLLAPRGAHYSLGKAVEILGLGAASVVPLPCDEGFRVRLKEAERELERCRREGVLVLALFGVAGSTEAGAFDDLEGLAALSRRFSVHFHVDAAWGGPLIFSRRLRDRLRGIEKADSITVDGHKQLYTPLGCGVVLFSEPSAANAIRKIASYIIRSDSDDLGRFSIEGSRPAVSLHLHASLNLIGQQGFEELIERNCLLAQEFAREVEKDPEFELICEPVCNILLYRWIPPQCREAINKGAGPLNQQDQSLINSGNVLLHQTLSKEATHFVSRTTIFSPTYETSIVCLRVVIANPLTSMEHLQLALKEQKLLGFRLYCTNISNR